MTVRIVNIRGTSGSGKSTLVRRVMELIGPRTAEFDRGRRQPLYYRLPRPEVAGRDVVVLGHYETACGGCDTITELDMSFRLAREQAAAGNHVIMEGLLLSGEVRRTIELHYWAQANGAALHVIRLTTPIEQCVANVQQRRTDRGDERPLNPKNTLAKERTVQTVTKRLREAGVDVIDMDNGEPTVRLIMDLLNG